MTDSERLEEITRKASRQEPLDRYDAGGSRGVAVSDDQRVEAAQNHMIIAVTGRKQHGKNTVCDVLAEHGFTVIGFADTLKALSYVVDPIIGISRHGDPIYLAEAVDELGWEYVKENYPEARRFLQRMGTEGARKHLGDSVWIDSWAKKVAALHGDIAVSDLRFANEAAAVRAHGGLVWKVVRPSRVTATVADQHSSETELECISTDHIFLNDGTVADLAAKVEQALCRAQHSANSLHLGAA